MYIWIGCRLPYQFEEEIRAVCIDKNKTIGLDAVAFSLPQHISLKISFETEKAEAILEELERLLSTWDAFAVRINGIEEFGNILWMAVGENETLSRLHETLDEHLQRHFAILRHQFDTCFKFHSTLFIDPDRKKLTQMREALSMVSFPKDLEVDSILLGTSETGQPGSYRVVREILLR